MTQMILQNQANLAYVWAYLRTIYAYVIDGIYLLTQNPIDSWLV